MFEETLNIQEDFSTRTTLTFRCVFFCSTHPMSFSFVILWEILMISLKIWTKLCTHMGISNDFDIITFLAPVLTLFETLYTFLWNVTSARFYHNWVATRKRIYIEIILLCKQYKKHYWIYDYEYLRDDYENFDDMNFY